MKKALLFLNGEPPKSLPNFTEYDFISCTDGAFLYLKKMNFPVKKLDFISGDFDTRDNENHWSELLENEHLDFIKTPDQDKTDFEKNLEILIQKKITHVDIFGGSGKEMDHFLGNLSTAAKFKDVLKIVFFDEYSQYFFTENCTELNDVKGKTISLYPFPSVKNISTKGLKWTLDNDDLDLTTRIGTRNIAENCVVTIEYEEGDLVVFISN